MARKKSGKSSVVTPGANPAYAQVMHGLRSSSAAGTHGDRRTKRLRSRSDQRRAAIREAW